MLNVTQGTRFSKASLGEGKRGGDNRNNLQVPVGERMPGWMVVELQVEETKRLWHLGTEQLEFGLVPGRLG